MVTIQPLPAALLFVSIGAAAGCQDAARLSTTAPTPQHVTVPPPAAHVPPTAPREVNQNVRSISVGERVTATLQSSSAYCVFDLDDLIAPCERYSVVATAAGTLAIQVAWDNPSHFLQIVFPWHDYRGGISCCRSPHVERIAVAPGDKFEIQVWFIGATYGPGGHTPPLAEQTFELTTVLEPS